MDWHEELKTTKKIGGNQARGKAFAFERQNRTKAIPVMFQAQLKTTTWRQSERQQERQPIVSQKNRLKAIETVIKTAPRNTYKTIKMAARTTAREAAKMTKKTPTKGQKRN